MSLKQSALEQGWEWDEEKQQARRPGLLGKLDADLQRIRETVEIEGASADQLATWMTTAMAQTLRDATPEDFEKSHAWLNRHRVVT